jgi:biotin carboxylase
VPVFPTTNYWQRAILLDRRILYERAAKVGVRVAPWMPLVNTADLREAARSFGLPMVVRGTHGYGGTQVRIVASEAQAAAAYEELAQSSRGQPFAQAFVQGRRCLYGALFERGQPLRYFAQETLEAYPSSTSPSIRVRSLMDGRLNDYARALFQALEWDGLACAEFIREDSGEYSLLEVNPRPWTAIQAAQYCGIHLFEAFAEHLVGRPITSATQYEPGVDCALFPQFLLARLNAAKLSSWRDAGYVLQCLRAAPWGRPRLMLHMLRRVLRYLRGIIPEQ